MMVEVLCTPVAPHAMVAFQENVTVTNDAFLCLILRLTVHFGCLIDQGVYWIGNGQVDVIVGNEEDEGVVQCE